MIKDPGAKSPSGTEDLTCMTLTSPVEFLSQQNLLPFLDPFSDAARAAIVILYIWDPLFLVGRISYY
jgi:hypothetical protein